MKRLIVIIIAGFLGYSLFWYYEARNLRLASEGWIADLREEGWQADTDLRVRGFPSRLDLTLSNLDLTRPDGLRLRAPVFQVLGLSYKPGHHVLVLPKGATLSRGKRGVSLTGDGLRASLVSDAQGRWLRLNIEADSIVIGTDRTSIPMRGVALSFHAIDADRYRLNLDVQALDQIPPQETDLAMKIISEIGFDAPWHLKSLTAPSLPAPRQIDVKRASYNEGGVTLMLAGKLDISSDGIPAGALALRAQNWQTGLQQAEENGRLPASAAQALEVILGMAASLSGRADTLDLKLRFEGGIAYLGRFPLGPVPVLR